MARALFFFGFSKLGVQSIKKGGKVVITPGFWSLNVSPASHLLWYGWSFSPSMKGTRTVKGDYTFTGWRPFDKPASDIVKRTFNSSIVLRELV